MKKLSSQGIADINQMLEVGSTPNKRKSLSVEEGLSLDRIIEFEKLSDLARISGLKAIRARLNYDAGMDSIE